MFYVQCVSLIAEQSIAHLSIIRLKNKSDKNKC